MLLLTSYCRECHLDTKKYSFDDLLKSFLSSPKKLFFAITSRDVPNTNEFRWICRMMFWQNYRKNFLQSEKFIGLIFFSPDKNFTSLYFFQICFSTNVFSLTNWMQFWQICKKLSKQFQENVKVFPPRN